jgi:hypothetical protein
MPLDKQFIRENKYIRIGLFVAFLVSVAALFPRSKISSLNFEVGTTWYHQDLVAPFAFAIQKNKADYEREQEKARQSVLPVFRRQGEAFSVEAYHAFYNALADSLKLALAKGTLDSNALAALFALNNQERTLLASNFAQSVEKNKVQQSLLLSLPRVLQSPIQALLNDGILNEPKSSFKRSEFVVRSQNEREERF